MLLRWLVVLLTVPALAACTEGSRSLRAAETDRVARIVADAISFPRQSSAEGFARAALDTRAARDGRLAVVEATDLHPTIRTVQDRLQPIAHLVFRVHLPAGSDGWHEWPEVTTCYAADFSQYGIVATPRRVSCPDAGPLVVPPPAPTAVVPQGTAAVLRRVIRASAPSPDQARLRDDVRDGLGPLVAAAHGLEPDITVVVDGADLGIGVDAGAEGCVLARRVSGRIEVWHPPSVVVQPGELSCDAATALAGEARRPPH